MDDCAVDGVIYWSFVDCNVVFKFICNLSKQLDTFRES